MSKLEKPKRHEDKDILEKYRRGRCVVCSSTPCDPCHIKSKGSGGPDHDKNLLSLCRVHHTEQHSLGFFKMCEKYPLLRTVLAGKGWVFDGNKKLRREEGSFSGYQERHVGKI